jgi:hypothetical protein
MCRVNEGFGCSSYKVDACPVSTAAQHRPANWQQPVQPWNRSTRHLGMCQRRSL